MKWSDLGLTAQQREVLANKFGVSTAKDVVSLALATPDILGRFVPESVVQDIRTRFPSHPVVHSDSSHFAMGAQMGTARGEVNMAGSFFGKRNALVNEISKAKSSRARAKLEGSLLELYSSQIG
jgi:hypothetical protein